VNPLRIITLAKMAAISASVVIATLGGAFKGGRG
jgi:hypothetical protein